MIFVESALQAAASSAFGAADHALQSPLLFLRGSLPLALQREVET